MLRHFACCLLLGMSLPLVGCTWRNEPELSDRERDIVERRNMYGEKTTFTRHSGDGKWIYNSEKDAWKFWEDPFND